MRQTACLVFNPIMAEGYAGPFCCTAVVQASDSMTALKLSFKGLYSTVATVVPVFIEFMNPAGAIYPKFKGLS